MSLTRREFLKWAGAAAVVGVGVPSVYGNLVEAWAYEVTETVIRIKDLPERFEGFRIAQVSDVHHSRLVSIEEVRRVVAAGERDASGHGRADGRLHDRLS